MTSRPRPSLLDLFDPLLADAVRVPIPESPPQSTPSPSSKLPNYSPDNKENVAPEQLDMSVSFNSFSRTPNYKTHKDGNGGLGPLIDIPEQDVFDSVGQHNMISPLFPRKPLIDISVDDLVIPRSVNKRKSVSPSHLPADSNSPSRTSSKTSWNHPVMSVIDSSKKNDSTFRAMLEYPQASPVLPKALHRHRQSVPESPQGILMSPTPLDCTSPHRPQQQRQSSLDVSTTLSSLLSSSSLYVPDVSFDLVNENISFLSNSEEEDIFPGCLPENREPEIPVIRVPLKQMITGETPVEPLEAKAPSCGGVKSTTPLSASDILHENKQCIPSEGEIKLPAAVDFHVAMHPSRPDTLSDAPIDHRQRTLSTISNSSASTVRDAAVQSPDETSRLSTSPVFPEKQETPLKVQKIPSVSAPVKELRVFTSGHQRVATASATQVASNVLPDATIDSAHISNVSRKGSTSGSSIIRMGASSVKVGTTSSLCSSKNTILQKPLPVSADPTATNVGAAPRVIRPTSSSTLGKATSIPHIQATSSSGIMRSRLPTPASGRDSLLPKRVTTSKTHASQGIPKGSTSARQGKTAGSGWISKA